MTVYLQDANYTRRCEGSHRKECEKGSHVFRNVISILRIMGQSLVLFLSQLYDTEVYKQQTHHMAICLVKRRRQLELSLQKSFPLS